MPRNKTKSSSRKAVAIALRLTFGLLATALVVYTMSVGGCRSTDRTAAIPGDKRIRPLPMPAEMKAVWVARFHYRYPDDIRTIMRNCAQAGLNTVLWQVRGDGTAAYRSKIEPWSPQYDHRDPGYDPLQIAVEQAHQHGLRIEAWVNLMPGWRGPKPPPIETQLWHTHPEWFLRDAAGERQPLGKFYVILNPCLPQVRRYLTSVIDEVVTNYDIDGVHLDYVRYAWDTTPNARKLYPRDPATLKLYRQQTGKHPDDDSRAWDRWRADQLTRLVGDIKHRLDQRRPGATLTAAVWSSPQRGYSDYFQDAIAWLRRGIVDAVMPMAYTPRLDEFERYIGAYHASSGGARIIPGLGIYKHETPAQIGQQLERCRMWGGDFALFSYDSLHATAGDRANGGQARIAPSKQRLRQMRTDVLRRFKTRRG